VAFGTPEDNGSDYLVSVFFDGLNGLSGFQLAFQGVVPGPTLANAGDLEDKLQGFVDMVAAHGNGDYAVSVQRTNRQQATMEPTP